MTERETRTDSSGSRLVWGRDWPGSESRVSAEAGVPSEATEPGEQDLPGPFFPPGVTGTYSSQSVSHNKAFNKQLLGSQVMREDASFLHNPHQETLSWGLQRHSEELLSITWGRAGVF